MENNTESKGLGCVFETDELRKMIIEHPELPIMVLAGEDSRIYRMSERGDDMVLIYNRIENDYYKFSEEKIRNLLDACKMNYIKVEAINTEYYTVREISDGIYKQITSM